MRTPEGSQLLPIDDAMKGHRRQERLRCCQADTPQRGTNSQRRFTS